MDVTDYFDLGPEANACAVGDFSADGRPDIIVIRRNLPRTASLFLNARDIFKVAGDINQDGKMDLADLIISLKVLIGDDAIFQVHRWAAINGDAKIGLEESLYLMQVLSGLRGLQ